MHTTGTTRMFAATALALASVVVFPRMAAAQCPAGTVIRVDYDLPGSGYSEESQNWETWQTTPCNPPTYRYLSQYVGDGTRKGKATWKPSIPVSGYYAVKTGFRPTTNRTDDADFYTYDDAGGVTHKSVDQTSGSGCVWADLGTIFCAPGGACRVVLDGTDDAKSDEADITTFELVSCTDQPDAGGVAGRCDGIRANSSFEVCVETDTTCAGVFTGGEGCTAYCAAAGMTCAARFGGEPGCSKEATLPLDCAASNGHGSDWCECEGPPDQPDAGPGTGGAAGAPVDSGTDDASAGAAGAAPADAGAEAWPGTGGAPAWPDGSVETAPDGGAHANGFAADGEESGCACSTAATAPAGGWSAALLVCAAFLHRRHRGLRGV